MDLPSSTHPRTNGSDSQHKATKTPKKIVKILLLDSFRQTFFTFRSGSSESGREDGRFPHAFLHFFAQHTTIS